MTREKDFVTIGKITKNQGNKGEIRVLPLTDFPERFEVLKRVFLKGKSTMLEKRIERVRYHKQFVILKLEGFNGIDDALAVKNYQVQIPKEEMLPLGPDQYYIDDLIDLKVKVDGKILGEIKDILPTGGTDIFFVKGKDKEYMIPAAKEFITTIDVENKYMVINPIPGLLDL